ncbi:haloacid dehalogenase [Bacillus sp. FJAT-42376]|uniref:HAD hydrolase family protein n=1 Tax=Bacillus sp. FJAT-42376 TaxID=2014076 RepID=UPI000F4F4CCE|nr:HAD hydrolase family protein [Bacillus sp. FJAT-42376]AZB41354.1 haloacid dehalogenase [Bacillus sp. FJAT-42376]
MIFASDLDQTLIYSRRSFRSDPAEEDIRLIETLDGQEISFMTHKAVGLLKQITERAMFVPVTTRTIEQFKRITLFQSELAAEYAVTSNGGNILKNGTPDADWNRLMTQQLQNGMPREEMLEKFQEIVHDEWVLKQRTADDLFSYCIIDRAKVPEELESFTKWLGEAGWTHSMQGRKLYFVPKPVSKWAAIEYIKKTEGINTVAAAGDSLLDLCLLENADFAYAPRHGELQEQGQDSQGKIVRTEQEGISASEEILQKVLEKAEQQAKVTP